MTRLTTDDVLKISFELADYDRELVSRTGCSLRGIACDAAGIDEDTVRQTIANVSIGVIPITSGQGIIGGFCEAVADILSHIGCKAFITQTTDAAGLAEAYEKKADIIMLSDDDRFVAVNIRSRQVVDNTAATGQGFAAGLNLMTGGLGGKDVLVIGCGPVGRSATEFLIRLGARVSIYDIDQSPCRDLAETMRRSLNTEIRIIAELDQALKRHRLVIDATPAADIIQADHITPETYIAAPGVPCGLSDAARLKVADRLLHDQLQIGVATMLVSSLKSYVQDSAIFKRTGGFQS